MRVISGTARGHTLTAPKGLSVRPTYDRVRESLFNILRGRTEGARVLDLFAGAGTLGIEALSREAHSACFVEKDRKTIKYLESNLEKTHFKKKAVILNKDVLDSLKNQPLKKMKFELIFLDPPYDIDQDYLEKVFSSLKGLAASEALIVLEHSSRREFDLIGYKLQRQTRFKETVLSFYEVVR